MARTAWWLGATAAFAAELASLAALAAWGATAPVPVPVRVLLGAGLPLAAAVLWALFAAPRAPRRRPVPAAATAVLVEGGAVVALLTTGHLVLAGLLLAAVGAGRALTARAPAGVSSPAG